MGMGALLVFGSGGQITQSPAEPKAEVEAVQVLRRAAMH
jgi:hypothetical protein